MEKLVRDKMPKICSTTPGMTPMTYRTVEGKELLGFLKKKLKEEVIEVLKSKNMLEFMQEMADVKEVIRAIQYHFDIEEEIEEIREEKFVTRGGFYNGTIWDGKK